ncbi:sulfatase family protein [Natronorubrum texcoconense]|uniref:Arylsulfatase A n=1 Tax=Natronorubrum texcoconense TaxID=1095776 RepID=A0A1G9H6F1_9EURY|nr:sulfatase-like hydrolase/transferase [Natronorubrum texcoconense]SDL08578.1 Arylsulfatase A [Natronorubrum texcoconense]
MNILFICVDCLREDFVTSDMSDTPFIDELVDDSIYFENMFSTTTTTTPCIASILTGCYSEKNGVNTHDGVSLNEDIKTLGEVLQSEGYSTYAMPTGPLVEETQLARGFDEYWYRDRRNYLNGEWGSTALEQIETLREPFFLFMHLWETHEPVHVPDEYDSAEYGEYPYARALSALDRQLERVVDHIPDDTLIVLHGDHGESITYRQSFLQHALRRIFRVRLQYKRGIDTRAFERKVNRLVEYVSESPIPDRYFESGHGENISDFAANVPFLISHPDIQSASVSEQVRQVDIFPTILDLLDIDFEMSGQIDGESLHPPDSISDRDAYIRACGTSLKGEQNWKRGIRSNRMKYIEYPNCDWEPEVYDLESDPNELSPLENADEEIQALQAKMPDDELMQVDQLEIKELLADLGYR